MVSAEQNNLLSSFKRLLMNRVDKEIEENFYNCGSSLWVLQYKGEIH